MFNILTTNYIDYNVRYKDIQFLNTLGLKYIHVKNIFVMKSVFLLFISCIIAIIETTTLLFIQIKFNLIKIPSSIYYMDNITLDYNYLEIFIIYLSLFLFIIMSGLFLPKYIYKNKII